VIKSRRADGLIVTSPGAQDPILDQLINENIRQRLLSEGFDIALNGKKRESPPRKKSLDGEQEAKVIALRLSKPPEGFANWSLRLLANQVVELGIVDSVSHETLRRTLKKTA
jgi:hypothetical protein